MVTDLLAICEVVARDLGIYNDISVHINPGEVVCILGDNGAGKSTLIKVLSGVHLPDKGRMLMDGQEVRFQSPREARARGIATVYQDLALIPRMPIWRNFFLAAEPTRPGLPVLGWFDVAKAKREVRDHLKEMGIDIRDPNQLVGTMSGGERQAVAIARAVYFGARLLMLDEPTSALGVKQAGIVLRNILLSRDRGVAVIFISHNPNHAYPIGDRFLILNRGRSLGVFTKQDISQDELMRLMGGGAELKELQWELQGLTH